MTQEPVDLEKDDPEFHELLIKFMEINQKAKKETGHPRFYWDAGRMLRRTMGRWTKMPPLPKKGKPKPNDPCPCGSGRKFKKCCA